MKNEITKNLRCLICQGQSVYDSQSDFAISIKILIKKKIDEEKKVVINTGFINATLSSSEFDELVEKIKNKNFLKPFPNINDIPN